MIQCEKGCHPEIYDAESMFRQMDQARHDCRVPSHMVPKCPVCGGNMTMHLRCDGYFVENEAWYATASRYDAFLEKVRRKKSVLLELGVGFNTPSIIKYPFWQMTAGNPGTTYICINRGDAFCPQEMEEQAVCIDGDIGETLKNIINISASTPHPAKKCYNVTKQ